MKIHIVMDLDWDVLNLKRIPEEYKQPIVIKDLIFFLENLWWFMFKKKLESLNYGPFLKNIKLYHDNDKTMDHNSSCDNDM